MTFLNDKSKLERQEQSGQRHSGFPYLWSKVYLVHVHQNNQTCTFRNGMNKRFNFVQLILFLATGNRGWKDRYLYHLPFPSTKVKVYFFPWSRDLPFFNSDHAWATSRKIKEELNFFRGRTMEHECRSFARRYPLLPENSIVTVDTQTQSFQINLLCQQTPYQWFFFIYVLAVQG